MAEWHGHEWCTEAAIAPTKKKAKAGKAGKAEVGHAAKSSKKKSK